MSKRHGRFNHDMELIQIPNHQHQEGPHLLLDLLVLPATAHGEQL